MTAEKRATRPLEEDIEFSNVTKFRNSLLGAVERMQGNPAKRYVITKHGKPEAVLMSYQTYSLLTKVMDQTLEGTAGLNREEAIRAAFARLRHEHQPSAPTVDLNAALRANLSAEPHQDAKNDSSTIGEKVRAIRLQLEELEHTVKGQDKMEQAQGAAPISNPTGLPAYSRSQMKIPKHQRR